MKFEDSENTPLRGFGGRPIRVKLIKNIFTKIDDRLNELVAYLSDDSGGIGYERVMTKLKKESLLNDETLISENMTESFKVKEDDVSPKEDIYKLKSHLWEKLISLEQNQSLDLLALHKAKAEAAIKAIYKRDNLPTPLIIWTKSPMANVFAKTAIDVLSQKNIHISSGLIEIPHQSEDNTQIRVGAWQSFCEAGWKIGDRGTGAQAWNDLNLYNHRLLDDMNWKHIPPMATNDGRPHGPNGLNWMRQHNGWFLIGDAAARRLGSDWLVDIWAGIKVKQSDVSHCDSEEDILIDMATIYDSRTTTFRWELRHQKNLNCLPLEVLDSKERVAYTTEMRFDFEVLRNAAAWVMPYENICFVSERHTHISLDDGRLHCEDGPSIIYPDGFEIYAWRGIVFPKQWIEKKPTPEQALNWHNTEQRRVACEMVGWETILEELEAVTIDKDKDPEIGELVYVNTPGSDPKNFLRVTCGTGRKFALPVPPEMETARQANAWTWGLEPDQYKPEVRT